MTKELILDFRDVRRIDIECAVCGVHVLIDVADPRTRIPGKCPSCQELFETVGLQNALAHFMSAYRNLMELKQKITVRVPLGPDSQV